jgi:hypothetical protein
VIIKIDPEFQRRIPKLRSDELELLRKSLLEDGCLEPITTWPVKGDDIIIDGHNRFRICEKEGVTFTTNRIEFDSRDEALLWIDRHQLGRRNLNDTQRTVIANRVTERLVAINKKSRTTSANSDHVLDKASKTNTREQVAKEANVPVRKLREVQEVVRKAPELEEKLLSGEVSLITARKQVREKQAPSTGRNTTYDLDTLITRVNNIYNCNQTLKEKMSKKDQRQVRRAKDRYWESLRSFVDSLDRSLEKPARKKK